MARETKAVRSKPEWFPFFALKWLIDEDVQAMTLEEEGAYVRLLTHQWVEGSIPADEIKLGRLLKRCTPKKFAKIWAPLSGKFTPLETEPGRLVNQHLHELRENYISKLESESEAQRSRANNRWRGASSGAPEHPRRRAGDAEPMPECPADADWMPPAYPADAGAVPPAYPADAGAMPDDADLRSGSGSRKDTENTHTARERVGRPNEASQAAPLAAPAELAPVDPPPLGAKDPDPGGGDRLDGAAFLRLFKTYTGAPGLYEAHSLVTAAELCREAAATEGQPPVQYAERAIRGFMAWRETCSMTPGLDPTAFVRNFSRHVFPWLRRGGPPVPPGRTRAGPHRGVPRPLVQGPTQTTEGEL